ncbi:MAG: aromatic amino acid lyase [Planctomycetaceae bacterium]|nr:aromatic amino acid lyase [Planctomycetaceae bacterium]
MKTKHPTIEVRGEGLTISSVVAAARHGAPVAISEDKTVLARVNEAAKYILHAVESGEAIYGVTTAFGANADVVIPAKDVEELQNNVVWMLRSGAGKRLPNDCVRAGMTLRLNSLMRGVSGARLELLQRIETFLNEGITPHMQELGSIGASGDLIPLATFTGCLIGTSDDFKVDYRGEEMGAVSALKRAGLEPIRLKAKEGLALINGTSVMTGIAALASDDAKTLLDLTMGFHALAMQALNAGEAPLAEFVQQHKAFPGQIKAASTMRAWLKHTRMTLEGMKGHYEHKGHALIQDRYSLRCMPQYLGPIVDGLDRIRNEIEIEINSANDNPLLDTENKLTYNCGNFLGQYIGVGMDQLRYYIGLMAKHIDVQISLMMSKEFSNGLPVSLIGNQARSVNMGLKGIQLLGNSVMPLLTFFGNSLTDRFPTHAEQFNQNINSQGFGSANLARQSVELFQQYMAGALIAAVQAADLRAKILTGGYDARVCLSPATARLYQAVKDVVGKVPSKNESLIWNDNEQTFDVLVAKIAADISRGGVVTQAVSH